ncbi:DnaJ homolog subfamily C member 17 [Strongyloides ratti]|uniref:DnaJ homolog subfamily C member 17 n=1 Tax=Strongyloides ratti TaxID=34506 RepID=A0A090LLW5_STRRB|nr:DnaJ homolog subfamily C member 17 [Strongyloides ratti]CEF69158.1 DnaJ homolog subfamily C member 17 [Strongyloides ratti]
MSDAIDYCPYSILGLTKNCSENDVKKAYKKAALKWHPDKNPEKKNEAQKMFLKIQEASTLLLNFDTKTAYDNMVFAREAKIININKRKNEESEIRKKFREDLEAREYDFNKTNEDKKKEAEEKLKEELNKLKSTSWKIKNELDEMIKQELEREKEYIRKIEFKYKPQLKVKWKYNSFNYTEDILHDIFGRHGNILGIVCSENNTAIIEFSNLKEAIIAEDETGIAMNPLKVSWVNLRPEHLDYVKKISNSKEESSDFKEFNSVEEVSKENFLKLEHEIMVDLLGVGWKQEYNVVDE